ncbi:MAG: S8 family serine peptidase, partial [Symploca sp. SIO2G7]|nr:S8 family serine peptidase [Symploca sp. SIO2G7]
DFVNNDGDPMDDHSHGTHVAGTIAAEGDNALGVIGVAPNTQIMALKFLDNNGSGSIFDAIQAIEYATMMKQNYGVNINITNNSWGGGGFSQALYDAIDAAGAAGQLFVAAAGNDGTDNDSTSSYPSNYDLDNIISVAATDDNDQLAGFSNFGATSVDLGAPGVNILSTVPGGGYASFNGTSMAAPHVSGVAALLLSQDSALTALEVKEQILNSVDPVGALQGNTLTGGRLNAYDALTQDEPLPGEINGSTWNDLDGDGVQDAGELGLEGWTVYLDQNQNGELDNDELSTVTDANGNYSFLNLAPDTYTVAEVLLPGWEQTYPTSFEYQWSDSNQTGGPVFDWLDISSLGTELNLFDDDFAEVSLPFNFSFYGEDKNTVKISSNGYLTFGSDATDYTNDPIPSRNDPNDIIAPFWDDLNPSAGGSIYHYYDASEEQFIVQYEDVPFYSGGGSLTFQAILDSDGSILFQYDDLNGTLSSATIGIEDATGGKGVQVAYNETYVTNDLAVSIIPVILGSPTVVELDSGEIVTDINFGNQEVTNALLGEIHGSKWNDVNGNGVWDTGELGLEGWTIYLDQNNNGRLDNGELSTVTDANGDYWFTDLAADTYTVAEVLLPGWEQTYPGNSSSEVLLTFDDISNADNEQIPDGYGDLSWSDDFFYVNAPIVVPGTGYENGLVSGDYVAFNSFANPVEVSSDTVFDFNSAYLTAAWDDNLSIQVKGVLDGLELYSETVTVNTSAPTLFDFDFLGIDQLTFTSLDGDGDVFNDHFALDNFSFNEQPSSILGTHTVELDPGEIVTNIDFGNQQISSSTIFGTPGPDELNIVESQVIVFAGDSNDIVDGSQSLGGNRYYGGDGDDIIWASVYDRLFGENGNDTLYAGDGHNILHGGADTDQFWIALAALPSAANTIADFEEGVDLIGIGGLGITFSDLSIAQNGDDALISALGTDLAILTGIQATTLDSADFVFA